MARALSFQNTQESRNHPTVQRQRKIRDMLNADQRQKAWGALFVLVDDMLLSHVEEEVIISLMDRGPFSIKGLKGHLRMVCEWLDWIQTKPPTNFSVQHAIRQTRHVGGI